MKQPFYGYVIFNVNFPNTEIDVSVITDVIIDDICTKVHTALGKLLDPESVISVENNGINLEDGQFEILPSLIGHMVEDIYILATILETTKAALTTHLKTHPFTLTVSLAESEAGDPHDIGELYDDELDQPSPDLYDETLSIERMLEDIEEVSSYNQFNDDQYDSDSY